MWFCTAYKKKMVDTPCSPKNTESTKTSESTFINEDSITVTGFSDETAQEQKSRETKVATQGCTMQEWLRI